MKKYISMAGAAVLVLAFGALVKATTSVQTIDSTARLSPSKTSVTITGQVACTDGWTGNVTVIVIQSSGKVDVTGTGTSNDFTCTGLVQDYSVVVNAGFSNGGTQFKKGQASAISDVSTSDPNDPTNSDTSGIIQQQVHISQ